MATNAVILDGSTQYGSVANYAALNALTNASLECWVNRNDVSSNYAVIGSLSKSDGTAHFLEGQRDGSGAAGIYGEFDFATTNAATYKSSGGPANTTWTHVCWTFSVADNKTRIFINGTELTSYNLQQVGVGAQVNSTNFLLYMAYDPADSGSGKFKGSIGGFIRLWNRILSQTEINANQSLGMISARETGLIANFKFSEGSGTSVANEVSGGNALALQAAPSWGTGPTITAKTYPQSFQKFGTNQAINRSANF